MSELDTNTRRQATHEGVGSEYSSGGDNHHGPPAVTTTHAVPGNVSYLGAALSDQNFMQAFVYGIAHNALEVFEVSPRHSTKLLHHSPRQWRQLLRLS